MLKWLSRFFLSIFLRSYLKKRFRNLFGSDIVRHKKLNRTQERQFSEFIYSLSYASILEVFDTLKSSPLGLSLSEVAEKQATQGFNTITQEKKESSFYHLWTCYRNPFNILLTVMAVFSAVSDDYSGAFIIFFMVIFATFLRFFQERRSRFSSEHLKRLVVNTASVIRRSSSSEVSSEQPLLFDIHHCYRMDSRSEVPFDELTEGDIVVLAAGDMIPADLRILHAKDLFVNQVSMTGESLPVEKFATPVNQDVSTTQEQNTGLFEFKNICFLGSSVVSGTAIAIVIATGSRTYLGQVAKSIHHSDMETTTFESGVTKISWLLIRVMLCVSPLIFLVNGFSSHNWGEAALFALSVAVGLTPEMLPMIVTGALARAAYLLSTLKVIVKRLDSIQSFGEMSVLCTDKTGTLTQDKIILERYMDCSGEQSPMVLEYAYLNSFYQTGLKNLLDIAVLEHAELKKDLSIGKNYYKIDEIPFDFQRRRMSVVVHSSKIEKHILVCKGAVEEMLNICSCVQIDGENCPLNEDMLDNMRRITHSLNAEGLRVVAVAIKEYDVLTTQYSIGDESDLLLIGYIAFLDPPKESTKEALSALASKGIDVKILTGDNALVTQKICKEVDFDITGIVLGPEIQASNDEELKEKVIHNNIFAKLTPIDKERIVRSLRAQNKVVGFIGDGINDAAAMRASDVGISVDSAVPIAKEAADIILLEKSLMILDRGVLEGRRTFQNMLKYIRMTASSNFGNIFSILIASLCLPFLPMLPMHLLVQNLMYDISQTVIPFDHVDAEMVKTPLAWNPKGLFMFMLFFGPLSSIFDVLTFAFLWFGLSINTVAQQSMFHSGWFLEGLISQVLVVHLIRTHKIPFLQSKSSVSLIFMTILIVCIGIFLVQGPFASHLKLTAMPSVYFYFLIFVVLAYMFLIQKVKYIFIRRFGWT